jgi:hypothetical protein
LNEAERPQVEVCLQATDKIKKHQAFSF